MNTMNAITTTNTMDNETFNTMELVNDSNRTNSYKRYTMPTNEFVNSICNSLKTVLERREVFCVLENEILEIENEIEKIDNRLIRLCKQIQSQMTDLDNIKFKTITINEITRHSMERTHLLNIKNSHLHTLNELKMTIY